MASNELMRRLPRLASVLLLVGCAAPQAGSADRFHALGTEPFWSVSIENGRLIYDPADGEGVNVTAPEPTETGSGLRWRTPNLIMDAEDEVCGDGMSMRAYPAEVTVGVNGGRLSGCGGFAYTGSLAGTRWQIVNITFNPVEGDAYWLEFTADGVSGRAGCNRFNGRYSRNDEGALAIGPLAVTRMACPGPAMEHERAALELFTEPVRLSYFRPGTLALGNELGGLLLRRID